MRRAAATSASAAARSFDLPPHRIAPLGIGRTFQNLALFRHLSVLDNVMVGAHCRSRSDFLSDALRLPWVGRAERRVRTFALELVAELGLEDVAATPVGALTFATQKRVELARALALEPALLLLDEPAGGLNHEEIERSEPRRSARCATSASSRSCSSSTTCRW